MFKDALIDPFCDLHTTDTAENIARKFRISREEQDAFAAQSQNKCEAARRSGTFKQEIVPIKVAGSNGETLLSGDQIPRDGVTTAVLSRLRPTAPSGTVTAGNSSGIADGAATIMLMCRKEAEKRRLEPMATIVSWAQAGVDPAFMGIGPVPACRKALDKAGWNVDDLDLIEANESFASQAIYVNREMKWDLDKVNVNGGAIALGHPFGASGARVLTTLLHEMPRRKAKKGLATLCIGGGMGIAMCLERV
jgi:acetyl-CoA C-acetyltransferase